MISLVLLLTVSVKLSISYCFTRSSRVISSNPNTSIWQRFHTVEKGIWTSEPWLQRESHWGSCGRTTTYNKSRWKCSFENTGKKMTTVANKKCTDRRKFRTKRKFRSRWRNRKFIRKFSFRWRNRKFWWKFYSSCRNRKFRTKFNSGWTNWKFWRKFMFKK